MPGQQWPLNVLQWAVNAEITNDVGLIGRVDQHDGLTVGEIDVGKGQRVNILITRAQPPLPGGTRLPSGRMDVLVATTITDEEVAWSKRHGRPALLAKLKEAGIGQESRLERALRAPDASVTVNRRLMPERRRC